MTYIEKIQSEAADGVITSLRGIRGPLRRTTGDICVQRLLGRHCRTGYGKSCECHPPWSDHATMWIRNGKAYCYIFQPYGWNELKAQDLTRFCEKHGLTFSVDPESSWHRPGSTTLIVITKAV